MITVNELNDSSKLFSLNVTIIKISPTFTSKDNKYKILTLNDKTGTINLTLWNEELEKYDKLKVGNLIMLNNPYIKKYKEQLQLSLGKFGIIQTTNTNTIKAKEDIEEKNINLEYLYSKKF